jgi:hypothetical protein
MHRVDRADLLQRRGPISSILELPDLTASPLLPPVDDAVPETRDEATRSPYLFSQRIPDLVPLFMQKSTEINAAEGDFLAARNVAQHYEQLRETLEAVEAERARVRAAERAVEAARRSSIQQKREEEAT